MNHRSNFTKVNGSVGNFTGKTYIFNGNVSMVSGKFSHPSIGDLYEIGYSQESLSYAKTLYNYPVVRRELRS